MKGGRSRASNAELRTRSAHALGDRDGARKVDVRQEEQELLPAVAEREVGAADRLPQDRAQPSQRGIPGEMPVLVVVRLEMVDVEQDQRERQRAQPIPLVEQAGDGLIEREAVPGAGQRVAAARTRRRICGGA